VLQPDRRAFQWPTVYPACIVVAAFFLLWPTARSLLAEWNDDFDSTTYTHGYLVAGICVWLLIRNRQRLQDLRLAPNVWACIALVATGAMWLVAVRAGIQAVHHVLMPAMMWLAVCAGLGFKAALRSAFAIGYLYFAIPIWGYVNPFFQDLTVVAVEFLLGLSGVVAYVDGHLVHLASGVIEIANGCSGLHFVIVGLAIGALYGEVSRDPPKLRVIQLGLALALAVVTNWIRVYVIIVAGYLTDMQHYLVTVDHYTFGWFVFAAAMIVYFVVVARLPASRAVAGEPRHDLTAAEARGASLGMAIAIALLAVPAVWNTVVPVAASAVLPRDSVLPNGMAGWSGPRTSASGWRPVFAGADVEAQGLYESAGRQVEVFIASYAYQAQGRELIGFGNSVLGEGADTVIAMAATSRHRMNELVTQREDERFLTWYGYRVGDLHTHQEIVAQVSYGLASLLGPVPSSVVALRIDCHGDCDSARVVLDEFMESSGL
jgi:exosortase A